MRNMCSLFPIRYWRLLVGLKSKSRFEAKVPCGPKSILGRTCGFLFLKPDSRLKLMLAVSLRCFRVWQSLQEAIAKKIPLRLVVHQQTRFIFQSHTSPTQRHRGGGLRRRRLQRSRIRDCEGKEEKGRPPTSSNHGHLYRHDQGRGAI